MSVGFVQKEDDEYQSQYDDMISKRAKKVCRGTQGMPVGVQVVTLAYQDEQLLAIMKRIEDIYQFHRFAY